MCRDAVAIICAVLTAKTFGLGEEASEALDAAMGTLHVVPPFFTSAVFEDYALRLRKLCQTRDDIPPDGPAANALLQAADTFKSLASAPEQQSPFTECVL